MLIRIGYDIIVNVPEETPAILLLRVRPERAADFVTEDIINTEPQIPLAEYTDVFGNRATRLTLAAGDTRIFSSALIEDSGEPDAVVGDAVQHPVKDLPDEALQFLLASRYCEVDQLSPAAWELFGAVPGGWAKVQAVCDWVNQRVAFDYARARPTKTALDVYTERAGVCRDFTHLAVTFCRALNIPARYCNGYLGDIGISPVDLPMDFNAWFEAYIGGRWYTFDARHNEPRIGRVLIARGRDAADVAMITTFGAQKLGRFTVVTEEVPEQDIPLEKRTLAIAS